MKKRTNISIEEETLIEAQKRIPNLSNFIEDVLNIYLGLNNSLTEDLRELKLKRINEQIDQLKIERYCVSESVLNNTNNERRLVEEQNKRWRKLFADYEKYYTYSNEDIEKAEDVLGKSEKELIEIMDKIIEYSNNYTVEEKRNWEKSLAIYNSLMGE